MALFTTAWLPLSFLLTVVYDNDLDTTQLSLLFCRSTAKLRKIRQSHLLWRWVKKGQSLSFIKRINKTAVTHKASHSWRQTESHCSINQSRTKRFNDNPRPKLFLLRSLHLRTEHNLTSSPSGLISDFMKLFVPACRQFPELLPFTGLLTRGQRMCYTGCALLFWEFKFSKEFWILPVTFKNTKLTLLDICALRCFVIWYIIILL